MDKSIIKTKLLIIGSGPAGLSAAIYAARASLEPISKFLFYPALFNIFILLDRFCFKWLDVNYYNALQLLCVAPMATNTIVLASLYKIYPEKVATAVLLSLLFVLLYMPIMATIFLQGI